MKSDLYNSIITLIKSELNKEENKDIIYNSAVTPLCRCIFDLFNPFLYIITLIFICMLLMNGYLVYKLHQISP